MRKYRRIRRPHNEAYCTKRTGQGVIVRHSLEGHESHEAEPLMHDGGHQHI